MYINIIIINLLHGNINIFVKKIFSQNMVKRMTFSIFANPSRVWLNRRQLDFQKHFTHFITQHSDNIVTYRVASGKLHVHL